MPNPDFEALLQRTADVNALHAALALMDWDQQCYMPKNGSEARAEHAGILSRMAHETFTQASTADLLDRAEKSAESEYERATVRVVRRDLEMATKLPSSFVEKKAKLSARAHDLWVEARQKNDFPAFEPALTEQFELAKEEAGYLGYTHHIYDALLDQYEEGGTAADCKAMFNELKGPLVDLVKRIQASSVKPDASIFHLPNTAGSQKPFTEYLAKSVGYDFASGRQDTAPHPFCTGWSIRDTRITTRYIDDVTSSMYSTLHEVGHALYEMGSPWEWDRQPLAGGVSLGVHESQSRLWENIVGRSKAFVSWMRPTMIEHFPSLASVDEKTLYQTINLVKPSLIRVEADEVTYNLHVLVRFELECDILEGKLAVKDLPQAWNAKYTEYLGVTPPNDKDGCLQDTHWSGGAIGYFPTYSMGNLLSYQIWNCLTADLGDPDALIAAGNFAPIHEWLKTKVYSKGRMFPPKELVQQVTGKPLAATDYLKGLTAKYEAVYELA